MINKIIVAIDTTNLEEFMKIFEVTSKYFLYYKIHSIFLKDKNVIKFLRDNNKKIFLDLKFFDIPATMERHVEAISEYCDMFTIHLMSGKDGLRSVTQKSKEKGIIPVGVSVLTSFDNNSLKSIGILTDIESQVLRLIEIGIESGLTHFVCSPMEIKPVKNRFPDVKLITPSVRIFRGNDDQKRVMSAQEALNLGADYIVIGREITKSDSPESVIKVLENL